MCGRMDQDWGSDESRARSARGLSPYETRLEIAGFSLKGRGHAHSQRPLSREREREREMFLGPFFLEKSHDPVLCLVGRGVGRKVPRLSLSRRRRSWILTRRFSRWRRRRARRVRAAQARPPRAPRARRARAKGCRAHRRPPEPLRVWHALQILSRLLASVPILYSSSQGVLFRRPRKDQWTGALFLSSCHALETLSRDLWHHLAFRSRVARSCWTKADTHTKNWTREVCLWGSECPRAGPA